MKLGIRTLALSGALVLATPGLAHAAQGAWNARVAVDGIALAVAAALLVDVLALRRVADGSMFGENLILVLVGVICLSASVLAGWAQLFMPSVDAEQIAFTRDLLVLASMVTIGVYFFGVRASMLRFVRSYPGAGAAAASADAPAEGGAGDE